MKQATELPNTCILNTSSPVIEAFSVLGEALLSF